MDILLIEDNSLIQDGLKYSLIEEHYNVEIKSNLKESLKYLDKNKPNLIILDISLPDGNGLEFYKKHIINLNIKTIFLTANDNIDDIVSALNLGACDYITKPFGTKELLARIKKILLRQKKNTILTVQDISFDIDKMVVYKNNEPIDLTSLELKILHMLFLNLNKVVKRDDIIEKIWEWTGNDVNDNTVTVYLKRIREKLQTDIIITIKGMGYRIDEK